jgi:hypothetical protein
VIEAEPSAQPALPETLIAFGPKGEREVVPFPPETVAWWQMWGESPLSVGLTATDWCFLLETARLHALFWLGSTTVAAELRLRVAKFGATPEDRARLRIQFAQADEADERRSTPKPSARQRRGPLKAV